jgi:microcystin-dependent protein
LFDAIETTYGEGDDPPNTFNLPDLQMSYVDGDNDAAVGPAWIKV